MIFGDDVRTPEDVASAAWIAAACRGGLGSVGSLVPNHYPSLVRVQAPDPGGGGWWSAYRELYEIVASVGERHTSTPDRAWFAVWEGHVGAAMRQAARFDLPNRTDHLLEGAVSAVTQLRHPGSSAWRNPDLFWPDRREWFVATDVDFWALYVGGDGDFIGEVAARVPTRTEIVELDHPLVRED
jgi:hypothetical protein